MQQAPASHMLTAAALAEAIASGQACEKFRGETTAKLRVLKVNAFTCGSHMLSANKAKLFGHAVCDNLTVRSET